MAHLCFLHDRPDYVHTESKGQQMLNLACNIVCIYMHDLCAVTSYENHYFGNLEGGVVFAYHCIYEFPLAEWVVLQVWL